MVELKNAKCPNCGASLQVNEKLNKTICQFCGSEVIIKEAIERYKVELSGKIEVDGIQGRNTKIDLAKKHIEIEEYLDAINILYKIVEENKFDVEAYIQLLKIDILKLKKGPINSIVLNEFIYYYDRTKKIDKENLLESELAEYLSDIKYFNDLSEQIKETNQNLYNIKMQLNTYKNKFEKQEYLNILKKAFYINDDIKAIIFAANLENETFEFSEVKSISTNGILTLKYRNSSYKTYYDDAIEIYFVPSKLAENEAEVEQRFSSIDDEIKKQEKLLKKEEHRENRKAIKKVIAVILIIWWCIPAIGAGIAAAFASGEKLIGFAIAIIFGIIPLIWCIKTVKK